MTRKTDLEVNQENPDSIFLYGHEFHLEQNSKKNMRTWFKHFVSHQILVIIDEYEVTNYPQASAAQEADRLLDIFLQDFVFEAPSLPTERYYRCTASCNGQVFIENESATPHEAWSRCNLSAYLEAVELAKIDLNKVRYSVVTKELI